ncbi:MAG: DUF4124 domain-containing protein [Pseudomonadota bacterium]
MVKKLSLFMLPILLISTWIPITSASSGIYKYIDKDGRVTYANRPISGSTKVPATPFSQNTNTSKTKTPHSFPRVNNTVQKDRDVMRRQIIVQELSTEKKLLFSIQKNLSQANPNLINYPEKIKHLQDKLLLHQRNIAALTKELANPNL